MGAGWKTQLTRYRIRASMSLAHTLIDKRPDDRYIVAHPRSGSTWLRTILSRLLRPDLPATPEVFNRLIPGASLGRMLITRGQPSPRLISSHTAYRRDIPAAVYMVRDGRDTVVSFYHYWVTRLQRDQVQDFAEFFQRYMRGTYGYLWADDVTSWLEQGKAALGDRLLVIRYEDLKSDTERLVDEVAQFLALSYTPAQLQDAINAAKLENMRKVEEQTEGKQANPQASFYRSGKSGGWRDYFTAEMEQQFYRSSAHAMRLAGYDI